MPLLSRVGQSCSFHHRATPNCPHPCDQPTPERPRHQLDMWPLPQTVLPSTQRAAAAGSAGAPPITGLSPGRGFRGRAISSLACQCRVPWSCRQFPYPSEPRSGVVGYSMTPSEAPLLPQTPGRRCARAQSNKATPLPSSPESPSGEELKRG
jgi:hypothetical protein